MEKAGFPNPIISIDGTQDIDVPDYIRKYEYCTHFPLLRPLGNWMLTAWRIYARNPSADYYAIFQDDLVAYRNLKDFLEESPYPEKGYLNLYTYVGNEKRTGWYPAPKAGKGAVALVFNNSVFKGLITHEHMVNKFQLSTPGSARALIQTWKSVDGGIVSAINKMGGVEYVHSPSLVQHTGSVSTCGNDWKSRCSFSHSFKGEDFDAMELLKGAAKTCT